ncbi:hypothetical protein ABTX81_30305 [Kitasatospora sp. NPDC097605]|uniref:hypothetical protein n=1 Tax=Kitasatospora sp. NPDC097605 TaxID=3157226 RepID=UPI003334673E
MLTATARRGPGQPPTVEIGDQELLGEMLRLVAEGASVEMAAGGVGWSRSGVYRMARKEKVFRQALTAAQKQGRVVRTPPPECGSESQYGKGCRCERCVLAAASARAGRRATARARTGARTARPDG